MFRKKKNQSRRGRGGPRKSFRNEEKGGSTSRMLSLTRKCALGKERVPQALPFPDRLKCVLSYQELITVVNNSSAAGIHQFCGNDLYDPNLTGTGGQPLWFDQLSALYLRYRVYASSCNVQFMCPTTTITTYGRVALAPAAATAAGLAFPDIEAMPRAQFSTLNVSGLSTKRLVGSATTSEIVGAKDVEGADRLQALVTASPAEQWFWVVAGMTFDPGATAVTITADVRISYYVEFYDRKVVTLSLARERRQSSEEKKEDAVMVNKPSLVLPLTPARAASVAKPKSQSSK